MDETVRLRPAAPSEAAYLSALALRSKAHWRYSEEFIQAFEVELTFQSDQIVDDKFKFVVAEVDSRIAGFHAVAKIAERQYELEALFVEPDFIGNGIGRALIQDARQYIEKSGGGSLVIQGDPNAERFYLAAGAKRIGSRESGSIVGRSLPLFEITIR